MIRFLVALELVVILVIGVIGLRLLSDQTTSLKRIAATPVIAGATGPKGATGAVGARGTAFPFTVRIAGRGCTVTNLWREGTLGSYEYRRLTYPATPVPFFCKR